jgi:hypothetical protein
MMGEELAMLDDYRRRLLREQTALLRSAVERRKPAPLKAQEKGR